MAVNGVIAADDDEFWLFGYGSLIWKPPPHYDRRIPGWVTGYVRRFWQDHRGTPSAPGRVVTLIDRAHWATLSDRHLDAPERVWGVAYRIIPSHVAEVQSYLDIREINGYSIHRVPFQPADRSMPPIPRTVVYIGTPENDQFMGPEDPVQVAEVIWRSEGPSGLNRDYLWELERALGELGPESGDEHVSDLALRVRMIQRQHEQRERSRHGIEGVAATPHPRDGAEGRKDQHYNIMRSPSPVNHPDHHQDLQRHEFRKVSSVDEQEETEKVF